MQFILQDLSEFPQLLPGLLISSGGLNNNAIFWGASHRCQFPRHHDHSRIGVVPSKQFEISKQTIAFTLAWIADTSK